MQITEIDPNKKYVIALPEARREYALEICAALKDLREGNETILVIYGTDVTVIPADQVVGYIAFEDQSSITEEIHHRYADRDADEGVY